MKMMHRLTAEEVERVAFICKALGDPIRVRFLELIASSPHQEACICELTESVGLAQPTVSHHMKKLVDAGIVHRSQRGKWAYYRVVPEAYGLMAEILKFSEMDGGLNAS